MPADALLIAGAFLMGSVPVSFLIGRGLGVDLRRVGSGNVGATNLLRVCGRGPGLGGLAGDAVKGALPALAALLLARGELVVSLAALAAVLGHVFNPWLGFRGGKGVATALGGVAVLAPYPVLAATIAWLLVLAVFRFVSLASIVAAVSLVPAVFLLMPGEAHRPAQIVCCLLFLLVTVRHRVNIVRLLQGTESRFGFGKEKRES
ncbi:glycerol-3-phosphate 1-O-acyltransferase PlsY [Candidatus Fermentibacterales bacterium]|nr:glycerol-3-phosphate 1-O-acyltransferase PlsY [Candidatus Fermentibacterales bacterium]